MASSIPGSQVAAPRHEDFIIQDEDGIHQGFDADAFTKANREYLTRTAPNPKAARLAIAAAESR